MPTAAQALATFAVRLAYSDIPPAVVARTKDCIADTIAAATFGAQFPWSRTIVDYALRYGSGGTCSILGVPDARVHAPYAALANGALAHAYELDSVGTAPHPGSALLPAVLGSMRGNQRRRQDGDRGLCRRLRSDMLVSAPLHTIVARSWDFMRRG